jgi:hypothetical protein
VLCFGITRDREFTASTAFGFLTTAIDPYSFETRPEFPSMQITLPDDSKLTRRAKAAGFATVEEYVLDLVERESGEDLSSEEQSAEEWVRRFQAFLGTLSSYNPNFDDSRESIYPVR